MAKNTVIVLSFVSVIGMIFLGSCGAAGVHEDHDKAVTHPGEESQPKAEVWTCSMHPQISETKAGKCLLCGMELILKKAESEGKKEDHSGHDHGSMPKSMEEKPVEKAIVQTVCPVMGGKINKSLYVEHEGKKIYFCCEGCSEIFKKDPAKYMKKLR